MGINAQTRLKRIEDDIKAMKGCYNTAGSLVKMYNQTSNEYTVGGGSGFHDVVIRFRPTYGMGQNNLISLFPIVKNGNVIRSVSAKQSPQDGSGDVYLTIYNLFEDFTVQVLASGTSPGTFTRIS